jgi:hypothetical protein
MGDSANKDGNPIWPTLLLLGRGRHVSEQLRRAVQSAPSADAVAVALQVIPMTRGPHRGPIRCRKPTNSGIPLGLVKQALKPSSMHPYVSIPPSLVPPPLLFFGSSASSTRPTPPPPHLPPCAPIPRRDLISPRTGSPEPGG